MGCTCVLQQKFRSLLCPLISGKELFLLFNKGWLWKWYERQWSISADGIWAEIWWGNLERYLMYHKFVLWLPVFVWTSVPLDFYFDMCIHKYVGVMLFFIWFLYIVIYFLIMQVFLVFDTWVITRWCLAITDDISVKKVLFSIRFLYKDHHW